jgi:hypothetical protein
MLVLGALASAQTLVPGVAAVEEKPATVTICQLKSDPAAYNHKLVEVTGFVSHAFEDFTLFDPTCPSWPGVWLEYGGKAKSGTMYCCGVTADRHRPKELKVEDISIPLVDNDRFREFDKLIQPPFRSGIHGSTVHATLVGRFFSGRLIKYPKATFWGGYGPGLTHRERFLQSFSESAGLFRITMPNLKDWPALRSSYAPESSSN